jgi:polar amino acid transport system substrate-binding protein
MRLKLSIFALLAISPCLSAANKTLILASDPYPPYIIDKTTDNAQGYGFVTDIVIKALANQGISAQYRSVPFKRAIKGAETGEYDAVLAVATNARPYLVYPKSHFGIFKNAFFTRKDSTWQWYGNTQDLTHITLGFITGYDFGNEKTLSRYVNVNKKNLMRLQMVSGADGLQQNLKKLQSGRIDAFIDDALVVQYTASKMGMSHLIRSAGWFQNANPEYVSIGFSKKNSQAEFYANALDKGIAELKQNGQFDAIMQQYQLTFQTP